MSSPGNFGSDEAVMKQISDNEKFGCPMAILFLAPAEGWKGPSGPAENLWPHLK